MADAQGDASAAADGLEYDCYGLPIFPLDQDDETMNPTLVPGVQIEMAENALNIEGPIIERVSSRSFKWVEDAFVHADHYLESLAAEEAAAPTGADDSSVGEPKGEPAAETGEPDSNPENVAGASADGEWGTASGARSDNEVSDDDEPRRFPSRSDKDEEWETSQWIPEAVLKRRRQKGATFWLIKWKFVTEPSWESEEDLVEEGCQPMLDEYIARATAILKLPKTAPRRPRAKKSTGVFDACKFWPDFKEKVVSAFNRSNLDVENIQLCCPTSKSESFVKQWMTMRSAGTPVAPAMLFHGTNDRNWNSIATRGFYIPGTGGVRVVNGSAYGVGIYTARNPGYSTGYVRGRSAIFVCAGLIESKFATTVRHQGDIVVFFNKTQVIPCALVTYAYARNRQQDPASVPIQPISFTVLKQIEDGEGRSRDEYCPSPRVVAFWTVGDKDRAQRQAVLRVTGGKTTKKKLKQLPAAAKSMFKEGLLTNPKSDRSKK